MTRRLQIAVIGAGECSPETARVAEQVGAAIAARGAVLVCGGLGGVMAAAATGARRGGGLTIGLLPGYDARSASSGIDVVVPTGMGHARNLLVVASGDAVIALPGAHGTASEIALALKLGKPVVALDAWESVPDVVVVRSATEAVDVAAAAAGDSRSRLGEI